MHGPVESNRFAGQSWQVHACRGPTEPWGGDSTQSPASRKIKKKRKQENMSRDLFLRTIGESLECILFIVEEPDKSIGA